ncbi:EVE domain-containing protein [Tengunoibacter tsumagoiensis]|uniref:Ubiquinol-cytochrome c reductase n=1 Tax=Tengunoibacter tsumagoiensis TaxID=2014871 RepID=A0A402A270_9CHLR|nr:EVE domain-containing protein [Tengunoibacter tsumagoiensis]GCE13155.1 ubiquinol-cytochrome c reductase [Tengunoibacter tsumagoiensis]
MAYFLAKTDPETYSIDQFEREQTTNWDGVRSAQALQAIRAMRPDDRVLIYHSMSDAALVGVARVISDPQPDPDDSKSWIVELAFEQRFPTPVTLKEIKATHLFDDWSLVRQSRLSTMNVPEKFVKWLEEQYMLVLS